MALEEFSVALHHLAQAYIGLGERPFNTESVGLRCESERVLCGVVCVCVCVLGLGVAEDWQWSLRNRVCFVAVVRS